MFARKWVRVNLGWQNREGKGENALVTVQLLEVQVGKIRDKSRPEKLIIGGHNTYLVWKNWTVLFNQQ
ncbi:MAG TPA: hypothetical protein DCL49_04850 [Candidatus Omnitrophica bacterium]|nr:hypothetical protein [Candidatus Omnitrophota bacterium]